MYLNKRWSSQLIRADLFGKITKKPPSLDWEESKRKLGFWASLVRLPLVLEPRRDMPRVPRECHSSSVLQDWGRAQVGVYKGTKVTIQETHG